jgi:serine/threonine-protein kinase
MIDVQAFEPGAVFHRRYEIVRAIKKGGMGAVYEVVDTVTRRRRALKIMLDESLADPDLYVRFAREATVTAEVDSDHIVETFDAGISVEGTPFLVMELLRGEDLESLLERGMRLSPGTVVALLHQAALALDRTHAAGIVHRDLKPANLFLTRRDDGSARLKILDFGIAKIVAEKGARKTTRTVGTPLYMAPEQFHGEAPIGPAADLYALGHLAYTMLVGAAYWTPESEVAGSVYKLLMRIVEGATEPPSIRAKASGVTLPDAFDPWFMRAVNPLSAERFGSATTMIDELSRALALEHSASDTGVGLESLRAVAKMLQTGAAPAPPSGAGELLSRGSGSGVEALGSQPTVKADSFAEGAPPNAAVSTSPAANSTGAPAASALPSIAAVVQHGARQGSSRGRTVATVGAIAAVIVSLGLAWSFRSRGDRPAASASANTASAPVSASAPDRHAPGSAPASPSASAAEPPPAAPASETAPSSAEASAHAPPPSASEHPSASAHPRTSASSAKPPGRGGQKPGGMGITSEF